MLRFCFLFFMLPIFLLRIRFSISFYRHELWNHPVLYEKCNIKACSDKRGCEESFHCDCTERVRENNNSLDRLNTQKKKEDLRFILLAPPENINPLGMYLFHPFSLYLSSREIERTFPLFLHYYYYHPFFLVIFIYLFSFVFYLVLSFAISRFLFCFALGIIINISCPLFYLHFFLLFWVNSKRYNCYNELLFLLL